MLDLGEPFGGGGGGGGGVDEDPLNFGDASGLDDLKRIKFCFSIFCLDNLTDACLEANSNECLGNMSVV